MTAGRAAAKMDHHPPDARHSTQPGPLGGTSGSIAFSVVIATWYRSLAKLGQEVSQVTYAKDPRVDAYIDALPEWQQAICQRVRDLVHAADPDGRGDDQADASSPTSC